MDTSTNNSTRENRMVESSPRKGWQYIGKQIKSFFSNENRAPMLENEIDYYHQYIYPHKANKVLKNKVEQVHTNYVPFSKRK